MKTILTTNGCMVLVDDNDYERVSLEEWSALRQRKTLYAYFSRRGHKNAYMHRMICGESDGMEVDHVNGCGLDNRRENLRKCSHAQNIANQGLQTSNTSGYKGVSFNKRDGKFESYICAGGKKAGLGYFSDPKRAAIAYDEAAVRLFGKFAKTNQSLGLL
jgi:HNH endonuclease